MASKVQKNIEDVRVGDKVLSQDATGQQQASTVEKVQQPVSDNLCRITYRDGAELELTKSHPIYSLEGWKAVSAVAAVQEDPGVPVTDLKVGDRIVQEDISDKEIAAISCWSTKAQTYNLTVGDTHTYYADETLVHNKGCECGGHWNWGCKDGCPASGRKGDLCGYTKPPKPIRAKYDCGTYACNICACEATKPSGLTVTRLSATQARISWDAGLTGGNYIDVYASTDKAAVQGNCASGCTINVRLSAGATAYQTTANALLANKVYYWRISNIRGDACRNDSNIVGSITSCTVSPVSKILEVGQTVQLKNLITTTGGDISSVIYSSNANSVASVNPETTTVAPYWTTVTANGGGEAIINSHVSTTFGATCDGQSNITVPMVAGDPWWQAVGAGVYAGNKTGGVVIQDLIPSGNNMIIPGSLGSVGALIRASGTTNLGSGSVSSSGWSTISQYRGKKMDYDYFSTFMGVTPSTTSDWLSDSMDKDTIFGKTQDFYYMNPTSGEANLTADWSVASGEKYVIFVNGNLRINKNITVANGGFVAFIVRGSITVDPAVTAMQGIYIATELFVTESSTSGNDVALAGQGNVIAWRGIDLNRDLDKTDSLGLNVAPAETFTFRPDLLTNMPDKMKTYAYQWQEVPAGTVGN